MMLTVDGQPGMKGWRLAAASACCLRGRAGRRAVACVFMIAALFLLAGCSEVAPSDLGTLQGAASAYADGGTNVGMSRFPTGPQSGLWAGNVETIPEKPTALPDSFYQKPQGDPVPYPDGVEMRPYDAMSFRDPQEVGRPVWVFADALEKQRLDEVVQAAVNQGRVVVVYGRRYKDLVGFVAPRAPDQSVDGFGLVRFRPIGLQSERHPLFTVRATTGVARWQKLHSCRH